MENKIKVIQISSASHSFSMKDYQKDIFVSWYARLAYQLKKFYPKIEVECWTPEKKYKEEEIKEKQRIKFRIFPTNFSVRHGMEVSFFMLKALKEEIKKAKKENKKLILHLHEYHSWQIYLILFFLKKTKNIKIIAQNHGGRSPFKNLQKYKRLFLVLPIIILMQFFENLLLKRINIFYALSDEEIDYLMGKTNSEIKFQTMGLSNRYFKKINKKNARTKLKLNKNKKYALYIGRLTKTKGIGELLDAMKKLKDVELLLMGEGQGYELYKNYAMQNKIKNVTFLGLIYGDEKLLYLDACDCLILPSYTEGAPVVLMEAIAKNLPVISTDVGGVKKMIADGREGIIIKPRSTKEIEIAVKKILKWKKKDIKKYANKYKWERIIKETVEDYEDEKIKFWMWK